MPYISGKSDWPAGKLYIMKQESRLDYHKVTLSKVSCWWRSEQVINAVDHTKPQAKWLALYSHACILCSLWVHDQPASDATQIWINSMTLSNN